MSEKSNEQPPQPDDKTEELRQSLLEAIKKTHDGLSDLSFALLEIQETTPDLTQSEEYRRGWVMYQALVQAEKFEI